ncbi:fungal hydrophobin domain-containing protein [Cordyceps javanica]|uniref:Hydrophobin n=1 Tax=Cordyceps javanica TaxID=43265 RepID=A0A545VCN4_9HYPO|nr:fungal hydrophobin domain-containing protein [Cordyceps javanica]TQW10839.1 fungal hydrophobin domain-containing protein [Cordyceps javanica]
MQHFKILITTATAVTAVAVPGGETRKGMLPIDDPIQTLGDAAAQCGNHQQISCCDKGNSAGTLLDGLLGGNCSPLDLSVIAIDVPISTACSNLVACCTGEQNGLLNLACTNINV